VTKLTELARDQPQGQQHSPPSLPLQFPNPNLSITGAAADANHCPFEPLSHFPPPTCSLARFNLSASAAHRPSDRASGTVDADIRNYTLARAWMVATWAKRTMGQSTPPAIPASRHRLQPECDLQVGEVGSRTLLQHTRRCQCPVSDLMQYKWQCPWSSVLSVDESSSCLKPSGENLGRPPSSFGPSPCAK